MNEYTIGEIALPAHTLPGVIEALNKQLDIFYEQSQPDKSYADFKEETERALITHSANPEHWMTDLYAAQVPNSDLGVRTIIACIRLIQAENAWDRKDSDLAWYFVSVAQYWRGLLEGAYRSPSDGASTIQDIASAGGKSNAAKREPVKAAFISLLKEKRPEGGWSTKPVDVINKLRPIMRERLEGKNLVFKTDDAFAQAVRKWLKEDEIRAIWRGEDR